MINESLIYIYFQLIRHKIREIERNSLELFLNLIAFMKYEAW